MDIQYNTDWVEDLFIILGISHKIPDWKLKVSETMTILKSEMQYLVMGINGNDLEILKEAQKRATNYYINGIDLKIKPHFKELASELLLRNQQPELALSVLQPLDTNSTVTYITNFGRALLQLGDKEQARQCFIQASDKAPDSAEPYFHLGFESMLSGHIKPAIEFYKKSLARDDKHLGSLLNIAYIYYQLENFEESIRYAQDAIKVNPSSVSAYLTISACLNANNKFEESLNNINSARKSIKDTVAELDELESVACYELKKYSRTIKLINRLIDNKPNAVDFKIIRARSYFELKMFGEALKDVDDYLAVEPYEVNALELRFKIFYLINLWREAEIAYIKLTESAPQYKIKYKNEYQTIRKNLAIAIE
ncbi:tetratricopeptide repeat protein [Vibrio sp. HN007]|uniref:tetratricopeptide repeat protein n=1 Tax=Vibrio iocasae TaxID=3098914 RepID=UPI0035D4B659